MSKSLPTDFAFERSSNAAMQDAIHTMKRVAEKNVNLLIKGETGTGKEWAARMIHSVSQRRNGPFVLVECAAIAPDAMEQEFFGYESITWDGVDMKKGLFEEASGGTLFLSGIGSLPTPFLPKLSQAIEYQTVRRVLGRVEIQVDTRVIASLVPSNDGGASSLLNRDLIQRISPIHIELPPLRERREDIPMLIEGFLDDLGHRAGSPLKKISSSALQAFISFDWSGNVRHLKNAVEYSSILCDDEVILPEHLPSYLRPVTEGS
ncbi:MAG: sigma 54-interacting transcriptional regulator [Bacteroidota bacterium]